ncbi:CIS tube protein [Flavobacterium hauense]
MELEKLQIIGYTDSTYTTEESGRQFAVQINPSTIKIKKNIKYDSVYTLGKEKKPAKYKNHEPSGLSFEIILDDTGVIPGQKKKIQDLIQQLEKTLYRINAESHEPGYAKVAWGSLLFHGRVNSLSYDYTLFAPNGLPLRVKISLSFVEHYNKDSSIKNSPDISRVILFKAGDTIPLFCNEIYGDASYSYDIARYNNLESFRNVKPGTKVMFPPLVRK